MNIVITLPQIKHFAQSGISPDYFMFFTEQKPNIIMDGVFTKITFSTLCFTMNGLFLATQFCEKPITKHCAEGTKSTKGRKDEVSYENENIEERSSKEFTKSTEMNKYYIYFDPYAIENRYNTECIIQLEETILRLYGESFCGSNIKTPIYSLKTQIQGGAFKIVRSSLHSVDIFGRDEVSYKNRIFAESEGRSKFERTSLEIFGRDEVSYENRIFTEATGRSKFEYLRSPLDVADSLENIDSSKEFQGSAESGGDSKSELFEFATSVGLRKYSISVRDFVSTENLEIFGRDEVSRFPGETKSRTEIEYLRSPTDVVNSYKNRIFTESIGRSKLHLTKSSKHKFPYENRYILKISGVWESRHSYGITYKCQEHFDNVDIC